MRTAMKRLYVDYFIEFIAIDYFKKKLEREYKLDAALVVLFENINSPKFHNN